MGRMIDLTENGGQDVSESECVCGNLADTQSTQLSRFILPILYGCEYDEMDVLQYWSS